MTPIESPNLPKRGIALAAVSVGAEKAKEYLHDTDKDGFDCVCMAHTHMIGDSKRGFVRLLESGAFSDVEKMNYMDGRLTKPQKEGFAIICQDKNGNLINGKTKIISLN